MMMLMRDVQKTNLSIMIDFEPGGFTDPNALGTLNLSEA